MHPIVNSLKLSNPELYIKLAIENNASDLEEPLGFFIMHNFGYIREDDIQLAYKHNSTKVMKGFLRLGARVNSESMEGAITNRRYDMVKIICNYGKDFNLHDVAALVPELHSEIIKVDVDFVCESGNYEIAKQLIESGSPCDGDTLFCAIKGGNSRIVNLVAGLQMILNFSDRDLILRRVMNVIKVVTFLLICAGLALFVFSGKITNHA